MGAEAVEMGVYIKQKSQTGALHFVCWVRLSSQAQPKPCCLPHGLQQGFERVRGAVGFLAGFWRSCAVFRAGENKGIHECAISVPSEVDCGALMKKYGYGALRAQPFAWLFRVL